MIDRNFILNLAQEDTDTSQYLMSLYNIPIQMGAKTIVEIGAGRSTFALVAAANRIGESSNVTSIDLGGRDTLNRVTGGEELMKKEGRLFLFQESSLTVRWGTPIDFLFLDSEHTYDLTVAEIDKWFPLVRRGGVIMCHDTGHEGEDKQGAVQALKEFMESKEGKKYRRVDLMDTKIIGMSILIKI